MSLCIKTDALSQASQVQRMELLRGKELAKSTIKTLIAERSEDKCWLFLDNITQRVCDYGAIGDSKLPRRTMSNHDFLHVSNSVNTVVRASTSDVFYHDRIESHFMKLQH